MEDHRHHDKPFPRGALWGAAALVGCSLLLAFVGRHWDVGTLRMPEVSAVKSLELTFADRHDGAVTVEDANSGRTVYVAEPGTNGFIRGVLRGLARERRRQGVGPEHPFKLTRWTDGRISIQDEQTGRTVELDAFGPTNAGVFAGFLSRNDHSTKRGTKSLLADVTQRSDK